MFCIISKFTCSLYLLLLKISKLLVVNVSALLYCYFYLHKRSEYVLHHCFWESFFFFLLVPLDEKTSGEKQSLRFFLWGLWTSVQNYMAIHPIVKIFYFGAKWWTGGQSHRHTLPSMGSSMAKMWLQMMKKKRTCREVQKRSHLWTPGDVTKNCCLPNSECVLRWFLSLFSDPTSVSFEAYWCLSPESS